MKIVLVDDEYLMLDHMEREVCKVFPGEDVCSATEGLVALESVERMIAQGEPPEYAFLDVNLRGMTGIDLAKLLKERCPELKIIFCTGYSEYAYDANETHAPGYILKPVTSEEISDTLNEMKDGWKRQNTEKNAESAISVQTFGTFCVKYKDQEIDFEQEKTRELLALLVDRQGEFLSYRELSEFLWPGLQYSMKMRFRVLSELSELKKQMIKSGAGNILIQKWNQAAVNTELIICDRYEFEKGNVRAINAYRGIYMSQYPWARFCNSELMEYTLSHQGTAHS